MGIRPVKPSDLPRVKLLIEAHADHEGAPFPKGFRKLKQLEKLLFGGSTRLLMWVIEVDGDLLGYMSATIDYSTWNAAPFVYLDCLYLSKAARGCGFGRKLMFVLERFATDRGIKSIEWQTPPDNVEGLGFYRHLGAIERPKQRFSQQVYPYVESPYLLAGAIV